MRKWHQHSAWRTVALVIVGASLVSHSSILASAQEQERSSPISTIVKQVVLDPTTYPPAVIAYDATVQDWKTSQPFFRNGFMEGNPRFTISGLPNDLPVSYAEGMRRIAADGVRDLGLSFFNNVTDRVLERMLITRYPERRTLIRRVNWIERVAFSASMSYVLAAQHFRQAQSNEVLAQQLGYR